MAITNRDRVARVMDLLKEGLGPFVLREYKMVYKGSGYVRAIDDALRSAAYELPGDLVISPDKVDEALLEHIDAHGWLKLMWAGWNDVFRQKLGFAERSYVSELMEARNDWAHQRAFTNDDAYRVADTASRLLGSISAGAQMAEAQEIGQELLRLRFEAESKKAKKDRSAQGCAAPRLKPGLKPWRHVATASRCGEWALYAGEFTADLSQVLGKRRPSIRTCASSSGAPISPRLLTLLTNGIRRSQPGRRPGRQLQTAFGGGKTHILRCITWSAVRSRSCRTSSAASASRRSSATSTRRSQPRRAGRSALNPADPRVYHDRTTRTLWGELAYQLGGVEGYQMVAAPSGGR